jgi:hypothetical protein
MKSLFNEVYKYSQSKNSKIARQVYNTLDRESIADIILDDTGVNYNQTFWFEHYTYHDNVSQSVYNWIINYLTKQGYRYLYFEDKQ